MCEAVYGYDVFARGLIEFTNICATDCYYCGIRRSNRACERYRETAEHYLARPHHLHNEDVFWALVPDGFRYPDWKEALGFSFDTNPAYCWRLTGGRLPMGCHSWSKPRMYRFWRRIIPA